MALQVSGVVSGIDTDSIISQLLEVEARSKEKLTERKTETTDIKDLVGELNTKLLTFKAESDNLLLSSTFQKRSAASTDTAVLTATVADGATPGTYSIVIDNQATATTRKSAAAGTNTGSSRRSTNAVSPGTSPVDLNASFASNLTSGFLPSTLNAATTVTVSTDAHGAYTTNALSSYSTVQAFMDDIMTNVPSVNMWYDSTNDRFQIERKNSAGGTVNITDSAMTTGFFTNVGLMTAAESATMPAVVAIVTDAGGTGLNVNATLRNLNTDTAIAAATSSSFTINGTSITYNTASDTLQGLINRINNSTATHGASAFYDQSLDRVVLTRTSEGPQTITLAGADAGGVLAALKINDAQAVTATGEQARFFINGDMITTDTNTYTFSGITLSLKQDGNNNGASNAGAGDPTATVSVTQDTTGVATGIKSFVTSYNDLVQFFTDNATYDPATKSGGKLFGDSLVNSVDARMKRLLFQPQTELTDTHELLAQLGIQLGEYGTADANKLVVDDAKLTTAISSNAAAVEALFGKSNVNGLIKNDGIAFDISDYITQLTKFQGLIDVREDALDDKVKDIDERMTREDDRMKRLEETLRRQFSAMETALATLNAEGSSLSQQLSRL